MEKFSDKAPQIIGEAAKIPSGIAALIILVVSVLAY